MMATPVQKNIVSKNQAYAAGFKNANLALLPANKYSVVTCIGSRIDPAFGMLTFRKQDVVGIIKNIGAEAVWELEHFLMGIFAFLGP
ncbi:hypothetical protein V8E51_010834 [Hyaloscypha variabilis]